MQPTLELILCLGIWSLAVLMIGYEIGKVVAEHRQHLLFGPDWTPDPDDGETVMPIDRKPLRAISNDSKCKGKQ
jgi:hypothetical protein